MNEIFNDALNEINSSDNLIIGGLTLNEAREKSKATIKEKAIERKRRKQEIIIEAINSDFIDLNAQLSVKDKKLLISLLTSNYTHNMKHQENYINECIFKLLKLAIPHDLYNAWLKYKDSFIPMVGFMYTASKEYGQNLQFKVSVDLPLYFKPEDCQRILVENWPEKMHVIDKCVAHFHKHKNTRSLQEVKIAQRLTKISTFYQLVQANPFWYDKLVQRLKKDEQLS